MTDVFYEMSKVTIKPVVNYTVLQIFLFIRLNFTLVAAFCTVASNISHTHMNYLQLCYRDDLMYC